VFDALSAIGTEGFLSQWAETTLPYRPRPAAKVEKTS